MNYHQNNIDDQLAEFTDRLLDGEMVDCSDELSPDSELRELQKMAIEMKKGFGQNAVDGKMAARIRANLVAEWERIYPAPTPQRPRRDLLSSLLALWQINRRRYGPALALTSLLLLLLVSGLFSSDRAYLLSGSAGLQGELLPLVFFVGFLFGTLFWWLSQRK